MRAFSLIEMMAVVAALGILLTIGMASIAPSLDRIALGGETDAVIAFIQRARAEAIMQRRCVQVFVPTPAAGARQELLMRTLNSHDCDGLTASNKSMASAPHIVASGPLWIDTAKLAVESKAVKVVLTRGLDNAEGALCPRNVKPCREIRFRPTGRLWSADANLTNDDVTVALTHSRITQPTIVGIAGNGAFSSLPPGY